MKKFKKMMPGRKGLKPVLPKQLGFLAPDIGSRKWQPVAFKNELNPEQPAPMQRPMQAMAPSAATSMPYPSTPPVSDGGLGGQPGPDIGQLLRQMQFIHRYNDN